MLNISALLSLYKEYNISWKNVPPPQSHISKDMKISLEYIIIQLSKLNKNSIDWFL